MIVDDMHQENPELLKDIHWNQQAPIVMPYTKETEQYRKEEPKGSAEVKAEEEAENNSTYYKLTYPFIGKNGDKTGSTSALNGKPPHIEETASEYESIDPSLFGRIKDKIRKSQVREYEVRIIRRLGAFASGYN